MFVRTESFKGFLKMYPIVSTLVAINLIIFVMVNIPVAPFSYLSDQLIGFNLMISQGEVWRLVTSVFLHESFSHFFFNMFMLILIGPGAERMLKPVRFIILYLFSGVGANILAFFFKPALYAYLGASGAILGVLGFFVFCMMYRKHVLSYYDEKTIQAFAVMSLISTFLMPNVGVIGHLGGFAIGFIVASQFIKKRRYI